MIRARILTLAALFLSLALFATGCSVINTITANAFLITPAEEATMGKQFAGQIEKEVAVYDKDPAATAYINSLGQRLVKASEPCDQRFTFKIAASEEVNAFAIPGGYCYVQVGLIRLARTEAELASVMAHEIAHVTARHGAKDLSRSKSYGMIGELAASGTGGSKEGGALSQMAVDVVKSGVLLQHSREDEFEADALAVKALARAGLNPNALADFFKQMDPSAKSGDTSLYATLLSTHPPTGERIAAAQKLARSMTGAWGGDSQAFRDLKSRFPLKGK